MAGQLEGHLALEQTAGSTSADALASASSLVPQEYLQQLRPDELAIVVSVVQRVLSGELPQSEIAQAVAAATGDGGKQQCVAGNPELRHEHPEAPDLSQLQSVMVDPSEGFNLSTHDAELQAMLAEEKILLRLHVLHMP
jgi:hypothetical protein